MEAKRTCCTCKVEKSLEEFHNRSRERLGKSYQCKLCSAAYYKKRRDEDPQAHREYWRRWRGKNLEAAREKQRKWLSENPEKMRAYKRKSLLKKRYGLTQDQYDAILKSQGGRCAICHGKDVHGRGNEHGFAVDHCHKTNIVRGLLCHKCNRGLGLFCDDAERLKEAVKYLVKWSS